MLSGTSLAIINTMSAIGYEIANGNETRQRSILHELYVAQRDSFHDSYAKFQQNMFTVKVDGRETAIEPVPLGNGAVLGIVVDTDSTIQNFDQKVDVSQWNISTMMTWLNFERALIEFGDLILMLLGAVFDKNDDGQRDADSDADLMSPTNRVAIPTHFYKIILHVRPSGFIDTISILLPHLDENVGSTNTYLRKHIAAIDEIEQLTGIDFLLGLADDRENAVEAFKSPALWNTQ